MKKGSIDREIIATNRSYPRVGINRREFLTAAASLATLASAPAALVLQGQDADPKLGGETAGTGAGTNRSVRVWNRPVAPANHPGAKLRPKPAGRESVKKQLSIGNFVPGTHDLTVSKAMPTIGWLVISVFCLTQFAAFAAEITINPDSVTRDISGAPVHANCGDIVKAPDGYYYWFGEDQRKYIFPEKAPHCIWFAQFENISCYRSQDLKHWEFRNNCLTRQPAGDLGPNRLVERPKVVWNAKSKKWVMLCHFENDQFDENTIGIATCDTIDGNYTYVKKFAPRGNHSFDFGAYQEGEECYILYSKDNGTLTIDRLTPDYMDVAENMSTAGTSGEAPTMTKKDGVYFFLYSQVTGWAPNANKYRTATSLRGPWSEARDLVPGSTNTWGSQVFHVITLEGGSVNKTSPGYIYVGDRYDLSDFSKSTTLWLPLAFSGSNQVSLPWTNSWSVNCRPSK